MTAESNNFVIECSHLQKNYADGELYVEVLKNIDLQLKRGEMLAIIGPSGCGKSTLLHLLGTLDQPTSGSIYVCGNNVAKFSEEEKSTLRNRHLGFIYQFHHLLPEFNALENITVPLLLRGITPKEANELARPLLQQVGLAAREKHRIGELSGGERQRVAIARALISCPDCVLADEPTGNLDHKTAMQIYDLICRLNQEMKVSFIVVTHDLNWAAKMHRTLKLENGNLIGS